MKKKKRPDKFKFLHPHIVEQIHEMIAHHFSGDSESSMNEMSQFLEADLDYWLGLIDNDHLVSTWNQAMFVVHVRSTYGKYLSESTQAVAKQILH